MKTTSEIDYYAYLFLQRMMDDGCTVNDAEQIVGIMSDALHTAWYEGKEKVSLNTVLNFKVNLEDLQAKF